ncbi:MAG: acyl-CoA dehydrogenase [Hyphomicrobiaceae bacterium]
MDIIIYLAIVVASLSTLAMQRAPLPSWVAGLCLLLLVWQSGLMQGELTTPSYPILSGLLWLPILGLGALCFDQVRKAIVTGPAFDLVRRLLPKISSTEKQALDAGTIGFDQELFSGRPDWDKLRKVSPVHLTANERAFLNGPTDQLCRMIDDWQIRHTEKEIPEPIWQFIKQHGFLGMLISKDHGGLGFSAQAQSLILGKISSRSADVATIVMVPNSLGPGELIEKYGTQAQKNTYLARLATGEEIPCFSLTGPTSGSDAATMRDIGVVEMGKHDGTDVLGIRLSWEKRYITLGPKATLIGLAFQLFDPANHLGEGEDLGITVAIIPADHPGVHIGRRHLPTGSAFPNGPNWGHDVFIPIDWIIGGSKMAGQGWRMLMECLSAGRAISLPSSSTAGAKAMLRFSTAYGRIRKQFGLPVARMQGLEEPLARMIETAYSLEAARAVTSSMVSNGERPSVISAVMKYQSTERLRQAVNDAMDLHGGRGICDGPANYLQSAYQMVPVGITVEGANILTRSLIAFAQGALRAHPFLFEEIQAAQSTDRQAGLDKFDKAFRGHVGFVVANTFGALFHNLTAGSFAQNPADAKTTAVWYKQLTRSSKNFALVADLTVATLGGGLKVRQKLSGRLADAMSELYFVACSLKRFEDDEQPDDDRAVVALVAQNGLYRFQEALQGTIENFPITPVRIVLRWLVFPLGRHYKPAPDELGHNVVRKAIVPGAFRDRMTRDIFVSRDADDPTGLLEVALEKVVAAEQVERKLDGAIRAGTVRRYHGIDWIEDASKKNIINAAEAQTLREVETLTARVIAVDHFDLLEVKPNYTSLGHNSRLLPGAAAE